MQFIFSFIPRFISNRLLIFFLTLLDYLNRFYTFFFKGKIKKNYAHNKIKFEANHALARKNLINNQNFYKDMAFGVTTVCFSGCEVIALYNALKDLNLKEVEFCDLLFYIESHGRLLHGLFGTNPKAIDHYFKKQQIPVLFSTNIDLFDDIINQSKGFILTVYNDSTDIRFAIHSFYVSIVDGHFNCHNLYGDCFVYHYCSYPELMASINQGKSKAICILGILK